MKTQLRLITAVLATTAFAACGSDDEESVQVSEDQAASALDATFSAARDGTTVAVAGVGTDGGVSSSYSCPEGGSTAIEGTFANFSFDLGLDYAACGVNGITIDGALTYSGSPQSLQISGELSFSGAVTGTCSIDITAQPDLAGGSPTFVGTVCGYDASQFEDVGS